MLHPTALPETEADTAAPARQKSRARLLPYDVYLRLGHRAVRLFGAGPFDEFAFFQRRGVSEHAEVEYLSCLDPRDAGRGRETYRTFGAFRIRPADARPLLELPQAREVWKRLRRGWGLDALPAVERLNVERWSAFDPATGQEAGGRNRVRASGASGTFRRVRERSFAYVEVLEILRNALEMPERIAWIEGAFQEPLAPGQVVHRYYLDTDVRPWLVRHHWARGKQLFAAELSSTVPRRGLLIYSGKETRARVAA